MAYVATRGGEHAIEQSERLYREDLGTIDAGRVTAIRDSMPYLVDRVMGEASLYEPDLAALALAQSGGDLYEAVLLLRAYRTTQPRLAVADPLHQGDLFTVRRISAAFKDIPGGQILGPTLDYSHRMLKLDVLGGDAAVPEPVAVTETAAPARQPSLTDWQKAQGLIADPAPDVTAPNDIPDLTREPLLFPASRAHKLQSLARADTGGMLALGYATMRGYGAVHPTVNELRLAHAPVRMRHPRGTVFSAGRVRVSQAEIISKSGGLELGFCATFGWNEVKTIAGASLDLASRLPKPHPASNEEFVLYHTEPVESSGFCIHFKLPHYVTFQSSLDALRDAKAKKQAGQTAKIKQPAKEPAE
ncbi:carbon-phosphorus lyase complex subunit PhnI [Mesorhizobium sp. VK25A]|uniref:Carbon-phosphorus lyase complex subunit PhnI n=1 Tax=Mesorhizobium vachelliae TaxID=3072309 RepID=A0ABU5A2J6_9HYPH|nr:MULTISPECIES: carbon-phosphorus lyase complex subunit PhnI [unclassified Mesorhizobium]MDX8531905.1 carbon-phosphorus lyase complex subunit PhnI [Mesorhizobium sp. VK25D]MDX8543652.1 carbon-phosphorus lyase complex subunit PhnI [Mesorhizobium sp. VK25A]